MAENKDIRHGMIEAEMTPGELRREIEKRVGFKVPNYSFAKALAGANNSDKTKTILRTAREILAEKNN